MTTRDDFDRLLTTWLDESAGRGTPDYLDETLETIGGFRQRPAWSSPGRWLPMQLTFPRVYVPRTVSLLVVVALLVAAAIVAALLIGSQRRLPPPFGLAATGLFVYDSGGDLFVAKADGSGTRSLVRGPDAQFGATWSRDGSTVAYWSKPTSGLPALWAVDADGGRPRKVSGELELSADTAAPAATWSPDGSQLAFATARGELYVVDADGARPPRLLGDDSVLRFDPAWSPDGSLIAFGGTAGIERGVYVVRADGAGHDELISQTAGSLCCPERRPVWSRDGSRLAYHINAAEESDIFIAERLSSGWRETRIVSTPAGSGLAPDSWPQWSNDGTRVSFVRSRTDNHGDLYVMAADGTGTRRLEAGVVGFSPHCWSPDDRSIVVVNAELDVPIGSEAEPGFVVISVVGTTPPVLIRTPDREGFGACSWQRLAP